MNPSPDELIAAALNWHDCRLMRCLSCDEGDEGAPCGCFEIIDCIVDAEKRLASAAEEYRSGK